MRYCALQERAEEEVRRKLREWYTVTDEAVEEEENIVENTVMRLRNEGYLDDERYARAFCESKLLGAHWSRQKVQAALRQKHLPAEAIRAGMESIDDGSYYDILRREAQKKSRLIGGADTPEKRRKLLSFLSGRGYTMSEIARVIDNISEEY